MAYNHVYLYVTEFEPRPEVLPVLKELAERYYGDLSWAPPKLDEANKYRAARGALGKLTTAKQQTKMKTSIPAQSQNTHGFTLGGGPARAARPLDENCARRRARQPGW